jgi:hypothetical protein
VQTVELNSLEGEQVEAPTALVAREVTPSSIGDLQWTSIAVDPALIAAAGIVPSPVGFAAIRSDGQLLLSDDALEWRSVASPFPGRLQEFVLNPFPGPPSPGQVDFSMRTTEGHWGSDDFVTWNRLDIAAVESLPPGLDELMSGPDFLEMGFSSVVETRDGSQLVHADWSIDWRAIALQVGGDSLQQRLDAGAVLAWNSWDPATRIVTPILFANEEDYREAVTALDHNQPYEQPSSGMRIRVSASGSIDDWVVELEDANRNEVIGTITGSLPPLANNEPLTRLAEVTLDDVVEHMALGGGFGGYFVSSGDSWERVEPPPWVSLPGSFPDFVVTDDEIYAYYGRSGSWRSTDGRRWQPLDSALVPTDQSIFAGPGGVLVAAALDVTQPLPGGSMLLRSENGLDWAPPSRPPIFGSDGFWFRDLAATATGFVLVVYDHAAAELAVWTSSDGDTWERVDVPVPFDLPFDVNVYVSVQSSGDAVILAGSRMDGIPAPTTAWIIESLDTQ